MTTISTTVGKNKKWSSPHSQQSSPKWSNWVQSQKWQNDLCLFPRQTTQPHSNPSLCPSHWCQRSWSWQVLWRPKRPSDGGSLSGSSVHGIFQSRVLEWVAIAFSFRVTGRGIDLDYSDVEWFALETNRDHSVIFEIASKYCVSDFFLLFYF